MDLLSQHIPEMAKNWKFKETEGTGVEARLVDILYGAEWKKEVHNREIKESLCSRLEM